MKEPFPPIDVKHKFDTHPVKGIEPPTIKGNPFGTMHDYHHIKGVSPNERRPRF